MNTRGLSVFQRGCCYFSNQRSAVSFQLKAFGSEGICMKDFRSLQVWEKSHRLTVEVYKTTANFPASELYGLTSQDQACQQLRPGQHC
jgi:hypothetical protein